jgi:hypothetical protein
MAAITDLNDLIQISSASAGTENIIWTIGTTLSGTTTPIVNPSVGFSKWLFDGAPGRGQVPTTAATICTNTTAGGLMQSTTSSGKEKYLIQHGVYGTNSASIGTWMLYDRLVHAGGYDANITSVQNINTPALTRYSGSSSVGNRIMVEIYSEVGGAGRVLQINYTNQDGVSGRTSFSRIGVSASLKNAGNAYICTLYSGDTGVRSIESVQILVGGTGVAGNFGVSIIRPLSAVQVLPSISAGIKDFATGQPGIPKIESDACLTYIYYSAVSSASSNFEDAFGVLSLIEK